MNAVTEYMKGFGPNTTEDGNNALMTCLLINQQGATILASIMLLTYFSMGIATLIQATPVAVAKSEAKHAGSSELYEGETKASMTPSEMKNDMNNLPKP